MQRKRSTLFVVYALAYKLYYEGPGIKVLGEIKEHSDITLFFPSQNVDLLNSDTLNIALFKEIIGNNMGAIKDIKINSFAADWTCR